MFRKPIDIISIGDITSDAFIRLKDPHIHCHINHEAEELCLPFGEKIPFEYVKVINAAGNAGNAAVAAARLGLRAALISDVGSDQNGKDCLAELQRNHVITAHVKIHPNRPTNYHFVLWYESDRTILSNHIPYEYHLPAISTLEALSPKWIYLTSVSDNNFGYHEEIARYLSSHPQIKLAFQPGTFQIRSGADKLQNIYKRTDFIAVNVEEAKKIVSPSATGNSTSGPEENTDIKGILKSVSELGPKLVAITDGSRGAYMFDGDHYYHVPAYPTSRPAFEITGCGDAWAATFVSALCLGKSPLEAFVWAPVNAMSVAQFIGSQEGLLSFDQFKWWLEKAPEEFRVSEL